MKVILAFLACSAIVWAQPKPAQNCNTTLTKNCTAYVNSAGVYVPPLPTSGSLTFYSTNTASSISTYLQQVSTPYTPKTTITFTSLAAGTTILKNWATNAGIPGLTFIPAGPYEWHIHALRTGAAGSVVLFAQFWEVDSVGADIGMIGQTESSVALGTAEAEYRLVFVNANTYSFATTASRLVVRVSAVVVGSSTPNVSMFVGGTADSHIALPQISAGGIAPFTTDGTNVTLPNGTFSVGKALLTNAEFDNGTCTTAATITPVNGNRQKVTLTNAQTCVLTFTQPTTGTVSIQLKIIQSAAGAFNGLISGGKWPGGTVPTITATTGAVDMTTCYLDGTAAYCVASQDLR